MSSNYAGAARFESQWFNPPAIRGGNSWTSGTSGTVQAPASDTTQVVRYRITTNAIIRLQTGTGASVTASSSNLMLGPGQEYFFFPVQGRESIGWSSAADISATTNGFVSISVG